MAQRVTIVDVAREAGVAISTVSAALNGREGVSAATRERVVGAAERMGWVPSIRGRSLVSQRAWAVGLLLQRPASVLEVDPFFAGFLGGVETVLDRLDEQTAAATLAGMEPMEPMLRSSGQFGSAGGPLPEDADATDRLISFIGRDPSWARP